MNFEKAETVKNPAKVAKLEKLEKQIRIGGKGTPRRKVKKVNKTATNDDKKLQSTLKKLNVQPIQSIEEVNMFREDGSVIHFTTPKIQASIQANTFAIYGQGEEKELTELVPGILNQLGPDSLASLRKLAESYQLDTQRVQSENTGDDDDIPELVENFEAASEQKKDDEAPATASVSASGSGTIDTVTTEKTEDNNVEDVD